MATERGNDSRRLDQALVERGLAESRQKAQALIMAGVVRLDGHPAVKPGRLVGASAELAVERAPRFVGRGGEKLDHALEYFRLDVAGLICLDVGASTGGFTDCLLKRGAARVYAIDVGRGQLHWRLRNDPRVVVMEGVNARHIQPGLFDVRPELAAVDVSFISLSKVLPAVDRALADGAHIMALIKPQFEAGRRQVGKGGVVRDAAVRAEVVASVQRFAEKDLGWTRLGLCESPLRGPAGNIEYLGCWQKPHHAPAGGNR